MDVDALLARIGAKPPAAPTGAALAALHRAYAWTMPFEDYDIHLGVPISLRLDDIADKMIRRRRGGYCYELNGLFAAHLRELGFDVTLFSAFTLDNGGTRGPDFDHLRLLVDTFDGLFLADVGNGGSWIDPVPLRPGVHGDVRLHRDGDLWWTSERRRGGRWERGWAWHPRPRELAEFAERSRHHEHDPDSYFVARRVAVLPVRDGRVSLLNGVFSEIDHGVRIDRRVDADEERSLLAERFGIVLDGPPGPIWAARSAGATA
jgi:N-hydroxyarylamine O-acetyltransferase